MGGPPLWELGYKLTTPPWGGGGLVTIYYTGPRDWWTLVYTVMNLRLP
jgi:hypothetical protein